MMRPTGGSAAPGPRGYRIVQTIGHGASSTVYEAVQGSTGRRVALKVVATSAPGGDAERLYTRERTVLAELGEHPHIVSIVDAGEWDGRFWLAMEHCPYGAVVRPGERLDVPDVVAVLTGIGSALQAAHQAGLVHCDVKPANILRNQYGSPALADFGIAKFVLATGQGSTATGYTLDHASPEVLDGERPTGASDVWSLGTALWEMLEAHPPFRRTGEAAQSAVIRRICFDPTPPLTRDDVPEDLRALIAEMTRKAPTERPLIAEVVARAQALQAVVGVPDPERWSHTIAAPVAPEILEPEDAAPDAPASSVDIAPGSGTTHRGPALDELTRFRAGARREWAPPVLSQPEPTQRPWRAWPVVAASVLAVLLLGSGSVVTWRMASAESAPVEVTAAPTTSTSTASSERPSPEPSSPEPVVSYGGVADGYPSGGGGSGTGSGGDSGGSNTGNDPDQANSDGTDGPNNPDRSSGENNETDGPGQPAPPTNALRPKKIAIKNATCRVGNGGCSSTTGAVAFNVAVFDSAENPITDDCRVRVTLTGGGSERHWSGACGSRVSFQANSGSYTIMIEATANRNTATRSLSLNVE